MRTDTRGVDGDDRNDGPGGNEGTVEPDPAAAVGAGVAPAAAATGDA